MSSILVEKDHLTAVLEGLRRRFRHRRHFYRRNKYVIYEGG